MPKNTNNTFDAEETSSSTDRQIYNGDFSSGESKATSGTKTRSNKKVTKRKYSTFSIVSFLFVLAVLGVLYTGNVIRVNHLAKEVNDLNQQYNSIISANEILKAEINRKSSFGKISAVAQEKVGLVNPKAAPIVFEIDEDKISDLQSVKIHKSE